MSRFRFRLVRPVLDAVGEATAAVVGNPLRSSLAGVAVAAAVATIAVVQTGLDGVAAYARLTSARTFGADTFVLSQVASGNLSRRELEDRLSRNPALTRADVRFLDRHSAAAVLYAPTAQRSADVVAGGRRFEGAAINGTAASLIDIRSLEVARGRFIARDEEDRAAQVVVVGADVADALFPATDPLGQLVRIGGRGYRIVGLLARQGTAGGVTLDRYAYVPLSAYERTFGVPATLQVFGKSPADGGAVAAEDRARITMRARRRLGPARDDTFDVVTPGAARSFVAGLSERVGAAGPPISLMALITAIVVVTNTVLVSVTQRVREIGVRRALGATQRRIVLEVLVESAITSLIGGLVGLAVAGALLAVAADRTGLDLSLSPAVTLVSVLAASASGLLAGWYPAIRASRIDVISALRSE
jgi:putative ABC transport system permease protein